MNHIDKLRKVATHNIARIDGTMDYIRVTDTLIKLAQVIAETETDETTWYLGESDYFTLDDLIIGAYWHYTDWHGGQHCKTYSALSMLGQVFNPGYASGPETDSGEYIVYELLDALAREYYGWIANQN